MGSVFCRVDTTKDNQMIGNKIVVAAAFFPRLRGLLGKKGLEEGEGMLLSPCSSIHCLGMKFPIDVLFLDDTYRVVGSRENMKPGSYASNRQARYVLELKAGEVQRYNIEMNEQLQITM